MLESPAFAQAAGASSAAPGFLLQVAPLLLIFVVFYFLLIRPQQKRMKEHRALIDAVKKGDMVVTAENQVNSRYRLCQVDIFIITGVGQGNNYFGSCSFQIRDFSGRGGMLVRKIEWFRHRRQAVRALSEDCHDADSEAIVELHEHIGFYARECDRVRRGSDEVRADEGRIWIRAAAGL